MRSSAKTVEEYLTELTPERQALVVPVLELVRENLPEGYQETMNWGMISWEVPLRTYPITYNKQPLSFGGLASQKNYVSLYLMGVTTSSELRALLMNSGKKLKMGKGCINYTKLNDLPLAAIAEIVRRCTVEKYIEAFERVYPRKEK